MKIDACAFLGDSIYGNSVNVETLLKNLEKNNVDGAIVRPFKPCDYNYDKANQMIAKVQETYKNIYGFGRGNPLEKTAPEQVKKACDYGLLGIHLHPWEDNFMINSPVVYDTIKACEECNFPVYISSGYPCVSEPLQVWELAMKFPNVTFIATHGGQLDMSGLSFDDALVAAEQAKNLKFDLSGVYRRDFIELLVNTAGEDNVLFGSCAPYMDLLFEIQRIESAQIPEYQKEKIFGENIKSFIVK